MVFCDAPPHTTIILYRNTHKQAHMEAMSLVICIRVSLHSCSMFKPHLMKRWLPCFLFSHMLPIRSRQTGSLPKVLRLCVQWEQETAPPKVPYQSTEFLVRPSAERFWIMCTSVTELPWPPSTLLKQEACTTVLSNQLQLICSAHMVEAWLLRFMMSSLLA